MSRQIETDSGLLATWFALGPTPPLKRGLQLSVPSRRQDTYRQTVGLPPTVGIPDTLILDEGHQRDLYKILQERMGHLP